jgi:hypothetical protein
MRASRLRLRGHTVVVASAALVVLAVAIPLWVNVAAGTTPSAKLSAAAPIRPVDGVRVVGSKLVTGDERSVQLGGVNRSGTEYSCLGGKNVFDGPTGVDAVAAMMAWHVEMVRLPLNEDCWLGVNGVPARTSGASYVRAVAGFVHRLQDQGVVVDLDLHWSAPGNELATSQQEMPDVSHSVSFWRQVAKAFGNDPYVIFELYNEPHGVSWSCWRNGCEVPGSGSAGPYRAAGMQQLVDTIRSAGAHNPLVLDGLEHASNLAGWHAHEPEDPVHALIAGWHIYGPTSCLRSCWQTKTSEVRDAPIMVTEFGETDCQAGFVNSFMKWLDRRGISYMAWTWNTWPGCSGPSLLHNYRGAPHGTYGKAVMRHLQSRFALLGS